MNREYKFINTLSQDSFGKHFEEVNLSLDGYILQPGEILYIGTLERISLKGAYIGRVVGRSTYARLGLSVNSSQDKFCGYNNAIVSLQLRNNSNQSLKIYPYQKLVQILFYKTSGSSRNIQSAYANESEYRLPEILETERIQYDANTASKIAKSPSVKHNVITKGVMKVKSTKNGTKIINTVVGLLTTLITAIIGLISIDIGYKIGLIVLMFITQIIVYCCTIFLFDDN